MDNTYRIFYNGSIIYSVSEYSDIPLIMLNRICQTDLKGNSYFDVYLSATNLNDALEKWKNLTGSKDYAFYLP